MYRQPQKAEHVQFSVLSVRGGFLSLSLCCLACLVFAPTAATGQETTAQKPAQTEPGATDPASLDSLRKQIEDSQDLDEAAKMRALELLRQASENVARAGTFREEAAKHRARTEDIAARVERIKMEMETLQRQAEYTPPAGIDLATLEQELTQRSNELMQLKTKLGELEGESNRRATRRKLIADTLATAPERLAVLASQLETPPPSNEPPLISVARQRELATRRAALEAEQAALTAELARYDGERQVSLVQMQRDLTALQVTRLDRAVATLQAMKSRLTALEATKRAQEAQRAALEADPALRPYAIRNQELADEAAKVVKKNATANAELSELIKKLESLQNEFAQTQEKVKAVGLTRPIGLLLRRQRAQLPNIAREEASARQRQEQIDMVHLKLFEISDARADLPSLETVVQTVLAESSGRYDEDDREFIAEQARALLEKQRELLNILQREYSAYFESLVDLSTQETLLVSATESYANYIDERVLWIRTSHLLTWGDIADEQELLKWLFSPEHWVGVGQALVDDARNQRAILLSALLLFLSLFYFDRRFRRELNEIGPQVQRSSSVKFMPTLRAALLTVLISLLWPGVLLYVGWRLSQVENPSTLITSASIAFMRIARMYFFFDLFRHICRNNGLAEAHFGWSDHACRLLRRRLRLLMVGLIPFVFILILLRTGHDDLAHDGIERLCFVMTMLIIGMNLRRIFHAKAGALVEYAAYHPGGWADRFKQVWPWLALLVPILLAVLAIVGYYYAAQQMAMRLIASAWLGIGILFLRALVVRWLLVYHRRLRMQQLRERRAALQEAEANAGEGGASAPPLPVVEDREVDLETTASQTRKLLNCGLLVLAVIGAWLIWADVIPALGFLDRWALWTTTVAVEEVVDSTGEIVTNGEQRERIVPVTVIDLAIAILVGVLAIVAARNVPGLLEMTVLGRLPIDAALRYAITRIVSYALTIIGIVICFNLIGIGWNRVQWLAAGLTVGLGFGLQEVFANFISGLIILFERPIRVGDIVTIGDVTGMVSRIRIRATTITNWDRKELIVPNKEFITGRLLNWTLTDSINRVEITVGVAYGSDTVLAHQLLLRLAHEHQYVMEDPAPMCTFSQFGDSSLVIILRIYLPNMEHRLDVIHDMHTSIDQEFRKAGIEIAFPQRDLHLRTVPENWNQLFDSRSGNGATDTKSPKKVQGPGHKDEH